MKRHNPHSPDYNPRAAAQQRYYLKHKKELIAKAKARYRQERDWRLEVAKRIRQEVKKESLGVTAAEEKPQSPITQVIQWFTGKKETQK